MTTEATEARPVVVGVDGSDGAQVALRWALEEARLRHAPLEVIHVWSPPAQVAGIGSILYPLDSVPYEQAAKEVLAHAISDIGDHGDVHVEATLAHGHAATVLVEEAARGQMLVVGARGLGGFKGLLLGSVSQQCIHHAQGPVVVVPSSGHGS